MNVHTPVLCNEVYENLIWREDGFYVDCTAGEGGHLKFLIEKSSSKSIFLSFEIDEEIFSLLPKFERCIAINNSYLYLPNWLDYLGKKKVDGILLDLGISSYHLEKSNRGFSYLKNETLDMRFTKQNPITAEKVINNYSYEELKNIFREYSNIEYAAILAQEIISARKTTKITKTFQLVDIFLNMIEKKKMYRLKKRLYKELSRIFQSIRIEVNNELKVLTKFLEKAPLLLKKNGVLCIISYHSSEDRIIKEFFKKKSPKESSSNAEKKYEMKLIKPSALEIQKNKRARSATLRVIKVK